MSEIYQNPNGAALALRDVTIPSGQSLSAAIEIGGFSVEAVLMPSAWDAANLTFQVSRDGSTFADLHNASGEVSVPVAANRAVIVAVPGFRYMRVRSGTASTPVNQAANRTIGLLCRKS